MQVHGHQRWCAGLILLLSAPACLAWGSLLLMDARPEQDTLSAGVQTMRMPRAPGSTRQEWMTLPALDYYGHSGWFASTENGVGYNASTDPKWVAGARVWPQWGRPAAQAGPLPQVGARLQPQAFVNWTANDALLLQSAVATGSGMDRHGVQAEFGATSGVPLGSELIGIGLSATWGNHSYRRSYLGLDGAGWSDWSWTASVTHRFSPHTHLDVQWQWAHLLGGAQPWGHLQSRQQGALMALWFDW